MGNTRVGALNHREAGAGPGIGLVLLALWVLSTLSWWGLAFYPVSKSSAEWLARLQYVCFGTMPDGLPAGFGWMMLFVAPGSFLAAIGIAFRDELVIELKSAKANARVGLVLALLVGFFALEAGWVATRVRDGLRQRDIQFDAVLAGPLPADYPRLDKALPDFELVDQDGKKVGPSALHGRVVLLTFAFAHCQTMCPSLVHNSLSALRALDPAKTAAVFITLDPWRDTPRSLKSLARKWEVPGNAHILSGNVASVTQTLDRFNVAWRRDEKTGDVQHPALVYVLGPEGRIAYAFNNPAVEWLTDAAKRLIP